MIPPWHDEVRAPMQTQLQALMRTLEVQRQVQEAPLPVDPSTADETLIIITADKMWVSNI